MGERRPNARRRQVISRPPLFRSFAALMRFEEERVACSMVREGAGKEFKAAAFGLSPLDGLFGRASTSPRSIRTAGGTERARHHAWHVGGGNSPLVMSRRSLLQARFSLSHYLLSLWYLGNKNWVPSMKVKKLKIFWSKMGSMGCKWFSLNAPGTENPFSHSILKLDESHYSHYWPSGVIRIGLPV